MHRNHMRSKSRDVPDTRKSYNCIVDESALTAGVKAGTLKKWLIKGDICMFVPLQTLERLRILSSAPERVGADARIALRWLDEITNQTDSPAVARIKIEGPLEQYKSWADVEKYMLPMPLLSMQDDSEPPTVEESRRSIAELYADDGDDISDFGSPTSRETSEERESFITYTPTPSSVPSSPRMLQPIGTGRPNHRKSDSDASSIGTTSTARPQSRRVGDQVPDSLRQFFNHIMWRIKQDPTTTTHLDSYILLTNDNAKQILARRFGIRTKRIEQMRDLIDKQDKELGTTIQNGITTPQRTPVLAPAAPISDAATDDDEEVILMKPKRSQTITGQPRSPEPIRVDPNSFSRPPPPGPSNRGNSRGGRGFGSPRSTNNSRFHDRERERERERPFAERPPSSGRGALYTPRRGGALAAAQQRNEPLDLTKPIDPDAFERGTVSGGRGGRGGRGRGSGRGRLWEPS